MNFDSHKHKPYLILILEEPVSSNTQQNGVTNEDPQTANTQPPEQLEQEGNTDNPENNEADNGQQKDYKNLCIPMSEEFWESTNGMAIKIKLENDEYEKYLKEFITLFIDKLKSQPREDGDYFVEELSIWWIISCNTKIKKKIFKRVRKLVKQSLSEISPFDEGLKDLFLLCEKKYTVNNQAKWFFRKYGEVGIVIQNHNVGRGYLLQLKLEEQWQYGINIIYSIEEGHINLLDLSWNFSFYGNEKRWFVVGTSKELVPKNFQNHNQKEDDIPNHRIYEFLCEKVYSEIVTTAQNYTCNDEGIDPKPYFEQVNAILHNKEKAIIDEATLYQKLSDFYPNLKEDTDAIVKQFLLLLIFETINLIYYEVPKKTEKVFSKNGEVPQREELEESRIDQWSSLIIRAFENIFQSKVKSEEFSWAKGFTTLGNDSDMINYLNQNQKKWDPELVDILQNMGGELMDGNPTEFQIKKRLLSAKRRISIFSRSSKEIIPADIMALAKQVRYKLIRKRLSEITKLFNDDIYRKYFNQNPASNWKKAPLLDLIQDLFHPYPKKELNNESSEKLTEILLSKVELPKSNSTEVLFQKAIKIISDYINEHLQFRGIAPDENSYNLIPPLYSFDNSRQTPRIIKRILIVEKGLLFSEDREIYSIRNGGKIIPIPHYHFGKAELIFYGPLETP